MSNALQQKLSGYETPPPAGVWEKIAGALDAEEDYPQRLFRYEETPPDDTWGAIAAALDETGTGAKVVPFFSSKKPLRYLAAASLIAAVLVTATLVLRRTDNGSLAGTQKTSAPSQTIQPPTPFSPSKANDRDDVTASRDAAKNPSAQHGTSAVKRVLAFIRPQLALRASSLTANFIPKQVAQSKLFDVSSLDDFMVYSDNEGTVMRLPKKLFSLVSCADGDGSCKERILRLREKLSANNVSPDFFGMLDQLQQLQ